MKINVVNKINSIEKLKLKKNNISNNAAKNGKRQNNNFDELLNNEIKKLEKEKKR